MILCSSLFHPNHAALLFLQEYDKECETWSRLISAHKTREASKGQNEFI